MASKFLSQVLFPVAALALLAGAVLFESGWEYAPYLFSVGAAAIAGMRLAFQYKGKSLRARRLYRMETLASVLMVASACCMFVERSEWFLLLCIAAVLQLYAAFMLPVALKKED